MSLLKLKAKIYKYTGIYLASREEFEYMTSDETIRNIEKSFLLSSQEVDPEYRLSLPELVSIESGLWQAKNGFSRLWVRDFPSIRYPWYKNLWIKIKTCYVNIKDDII